MSLVGVEVGKLSKLTLSLHRNQSEFKGCFPLCQRFRKFRLEFKWKSPFRFLPTGIFGITSGGGPLISVGIFRPKFVVPFLTNRFFALIREFERKTNSGKSHSYWLDRFNRKMSFHFAGKFPLISDRLVWHNGKHPNSSFTTAYTPCTRHQIKLTP